MIDALSDLKSPLETILLVEDEALIRMGVAEFLRECGYRVHEASNAPEAMDMLNSRLPVDLVITDIYMPTPSGVDGLALAKWIRSRHPEMEVIVTSGVVGPIDLPVDAPLTGPILVKPYTRRYLIERIKDALAKRRPRRGKIEGDTRREAASH
ncbi:MAG TPA: response regulator [Roseiarcus sp.]|nr:response regulator [Roseiarcus sp.]